MSSSGETIKRATDGTLQKAEKPQDEKEIGKECSQPQSYADYQQLRDRESGNNH